MRYFTLAIAMLAATAHAAAIYDNSKNDPQQTVFFSDGPYSEIGDRLLLGGTERLTTSATVQFYNLGLAGTFDALLRFYIPGAPVGAPLGSAFALTSQTAPSRSSFDLTFTNLALLIPGNEVIFTIEVQNASNGVVLGLNLFDPPNNAGSSSTSFLIVNDSQFKEIGAGSNSNLFFQLEAVTSPVPEPSAFLLTAAGGLLLLLGSRRTRK